MTLWSKILNATDAAREGVEDEFEKRLRKPRATVAPPGSDQKLKVLAKRMENGEHLYSENDVTEYGDDGDYEPRSHLPWERSR